MTAGQRRQEEQAGSRQGKGGGHDGERAFPVDESSRAVSDDGRRESAGKQEEPDCSRIQSVHPPEHERHRHHHAEIDAGIDRTEQQAAAVGADGEQPGRNERRWRLLLADEKCGQQDESQEHQPSAQSETNEKEGDRRGIAAFALFPEGGANGPHVPGRAGAAHFAAGAEPDHRQTGKGAGRPPV